jgi:hypothetical protein
MSFLKKSVPELQEEIEHYANELIGIASPLERSAPLSINARTIGVKMQELASDASQHKIDFLSKGNREIANVYAQEIDTLAQLAEIFYGSALEKIGSVKAGKIEKLCRMLLVFAAGINNLFKQISLTPKLRAQAG